MNWRTAAMIVAGVVLSVWGVLHLLTPKTEQSGPVPSATATISAVQPSDQASGTADPTGSASPTLSSDPLPASGEEAGPISAEQVSEAKQVGTAFLNAVETYGPGVTMDDALKTAMAHMNDVMLDTLDLTEPITDAEYDVRIEQGLTHQVAIDSLIATSGRLDEQGSVLELVVTMRSAWTQPGAKGVPADQLPVRMVITMFDSEGDDAGWGVANYEPA